MKLFHSLFVLSFFTLSACNEVQSSAARKLSENHPKSSNALPEDEDIDPSDKSKDKDSSGDQQSETDKTSDPNKNDEPDTNTGTLDPMTPDPMPEPMKPSFPNLTGKIRLMPLGASFTQGVGSKKAGYRGFLHEKLSKDKIEHQFVGSSKAQPSDLPADQQSHEGHPGFVIAKGTSGRDGITDHFKDWLGASVDPQIIMILVGSNDVDLNYKFDEIGVRFDAMITQILDKEKGLKPNAIILASSIPINGDATKEERTKKYNAHIKETVDKHFAKGELIYFIDTHAVLTKADMTDNLHANDNGYPKVADLFLTKIKELIQKSKEANSN